MVSKLAIDESQFTSSDGGRNLAEFSEIFVREHEFRPRSSDDTQESAEHPERAASFCESVASSLHSQGTQAVKTS